MNDVKSLSQSLPLRVYKLEYQEPHRICPKESQKEILWRKKTRDRRKFANAVKLEIRNVEAEVRPDHVHMLVEMLEKVNASSFMW